MSVFLRRMGRGPGTWRACFGAAARLSLVWGPADLRSKAAALPFVMRGTAPLQEVDLNEVIANALDALLPEARKRNIGMSANGMHQRLRGNRIHLQQVIINLATNGMDAMVDVATGARKLIIQTALTGDSDVQVSVSDSGTGIPNQELSRIFDTVYTTKERGPGLRLSIARTIIQACGGKIWAENQDAGGAVFRFTLPLIDAA